jgi:galactonate dehydratase
MKVTAVETIQLAEFANLVWVHVLTDDGLIGLGETFFGGDAVAAYIHESAAPYLLGKDPLRIDEHSHVLRSTYVGFSGSGAEMRGLSAIDIALWDIFGQVTGQPIHQLLGGLSRERIRTYNTCAGYGYVRARLNQITGQWQAKGAVAEGPYEDFEAFLNRADELALSLLEQGITGMKIWPFDAYAEASKGTYISGPDLARALAPFRKIREAVGNRMDVMVELHSLWNLPTAKRIMAALEEFDPFWFEDPIRMNNADGLAELARSTRVPITASETLATRAAYREFISRGAIGIVMPDLSWIGGIS